MAESSLPLLLVLLTPVALGCGPEEAKRARPPECSSYSCPVGTYADEYRSLEESSGQYVNVVEGECRYACVAAQPCPEGWWPIITEECFSCATTLPSGESVGGDCDSDSWALWSEPGSGESEPTGCTGATATRRLSEPDDTRADATDLGTLRGGLKATGQFHITDDTYFCGRGSSTGNYGEVDWFRFELDCTDDATFEVVADSFIPSLFVYQDDVLVAAPRSEGRGERFVEIPDLTGVVEVGVACWEAPSSDYFVELTF